MLESAASGSRRAVFISLHITDRKNKAPKDKRDDAEVETCVQMLNSSNYQHKTELRSGDFGLHVVLAFFLLSGSFFLQTKIIDSSAGGGFSILSALINYIPLSLKGVIHI